MFGISGSELLFYGGIALMIISAISAIVCVFAFIFTGQKLKRNLESEYGKSQR